MTEEDFLTRWSRRKRSSADGAKPVPESAPIPAEALPNPAGPVVASIDPVFDPATLPPIDSISAVSDISAFLQKGVPAELTRAALRRVWTADPAIRDFVGLAENAWDFTDPNAMPGFGPLESTDEVRRMITDLVDRIGQAAKPSVAEAGTGPVQVAENSSDSNPPAAPATDERSSGESCVSNAEIAQNPSDQVLVRSNKESAATQHDAAEHHADFNQLSHRRPHGGALPR
jgi:Protein of unknown function (DUF3306)